MPRLFQNEVCQPETQRHLTRCPPTDALAVSSGCSCLPGTSPRLVSRAGPACTPIMLLAYLLFPPRGRRHGFLQGGAGGACTLGLSAAGGQGLQCAPLHLQGEPMLGEGLPPESLGAQVSSGGLEESEQEISRSRDVLDLPQDSQLGLYGKRSTHSSPPLLHTRCHSTKLVGPPLRP